MQESSLDRIKSWHELVDYLSRYSRRIQECAAYRVYVLSVKLRKFMHHAKRISGRFTRKCPQIPECLQLRIISRFLSQLEGSCAKPARVLLNDPKRNYGRWRRMRRDVRAHSWSHVEGDGRKDSIVCEIMAKLLNPTQSAELYGANGLSPLCACA